MVVVAVVVKMAVGWLQTSHLEQRLAVLAAVVMVLMELTEIGRLDQQLQVRPILAVVVAVLCGGEVRMLEQVVRALQS